MASMCATSTKVFVLEVMGRHAGWIAAAGAMASTKDNEIPIIVLFPEVKFRPEANSLKRLKRKLKSLVTVLSLFLKVLHWPDGRFLAETGLKDAFGHSQLGGAAPVIAT